MRRTLDTVVAQSVPPALWVIVDDGSTDETPRILAEYQAKHDWITVVTRKDRGRRAVGLKKVIGSLGDRLKRIPQESADPAHLNLGDRVPEPLLRAH